MPDESNLPELTTSVTDPPEHSATPATADPNPQVGRLDVAVIAVRMTSFWFAYSSLPLITGVAWMFTAGGPSWRLGVMTYAPYGFLLGFAITLWAMAVPISRRVLAGVPASSRAPAAGGAMTAAASTAGHSVALSVAGAVVAALALRHLGEAVGDLFPLDSRPDPVDVAPYVRRALLQFVVEAASGVGLFVGAPGLTRLWLRLRTVPAVSSADDDSGPDASGRHDPGQAGELPGGQVPTPTPPPGTTPPTTP